MAVYYISVDLSIYNIVTFIITLNSQKYFKNILNVCILNNLNTMYPQYLHFIEECGSKKSANLLKLKR